MKTQENRVAETARKAAQSRFSHYHQVMSSLQPRENAQKPARQETKKPSKSK